MARWVYQIGDHGIGPEWPFQPQSPTLNFYLTGQPHDFTCTIDGHSVAGLNLRELAQDVWVHRDGELLFRGPLMGCGDTGDGNGQQVQLTANSYRARLAGWEIPPGGANGMVSLGAAATASGLGWRAISLKLPSSDLASIITDAHGLSGGGVQITQSAQGGSQIDAAIDTLTAVQAFDWDMVPNDTTGKVAYQTWSPTRGTQKPERRLLYDGSGKTGGSNCTYARTFDMGSFANRLYLTGQNTSGASVTATASIPAGPEGLWETTADASNIDSSQLQAQANLQLATAQTPTAAYTLTPTDQGWWKGPDDIWLGDSPQLILKDGRLNVNDVIRVQQITLSPADGADNVQITVGAKPLGPKGEFALVRTFRNLDKRLKSLEWRQ